MNPINKNGGDASRRHFMKGCAIAGAAALGPVHLLGAQNDPTQDKLNIAVVGVGGRGGSNLNGCSGENIYALCDINKSTTAKAKQRFKDAIVTTDWRTLIDDPKIDAFVVSTADHHHALVSIAAMRAGKHVYCEKPLAHTVYEARWMQDEYKKRKGEIATQMGTQIHATGNYRRAVEIVQSGMLGAVTEAHVWCSRGISPVGQSVLSEQPVPETFDWDVWLGPAADRAYNKSYWSGGNLNWNRRWEFGNGVLGDMGSHLIDLPYWALELRRPTSVVSEGPEPDPVGCPPWQQVTWEHPARDGDGPHHAECKVVWYHGSEGMKRRAAYLQPKIGKDTDLGKWGIGVAFIGDRGVLVTDYGKMVLSPSADFADVPRPEVTIEPSLGHYKEWIHAAKTGGESLCNFDYSGALIEHNLLGNVAHRAGKKLQWDADSLKFTNDAAANSLLTKSYRDGWSV